VTSRFLVALAAAALIAPAAPLRASGPIVLDEIRGPIQVVVAGHVARVVAHADAEGASLLVFSMDTPGGDVGSTRDIIQSILASRTPVVVFVGPSGSRAASAGFYIAFAADVAAMAPGTQIGAAHPVTPFGQNTKDDIMLQKVENDLAAQARTIAQNRKRNADLAEKIVRDSVSVTETEALDQHLIDYVAHDLDALLRTLDGKTIRRFDGAESVARKVGAPREPFGLTRRERLLGAIADPNVAIVLLVVGLLGLYVEFTHPGVIAPGIIGGASLFLFALATQILPLNLLGLILIGIGIGLFVLEIKVASFGLLTAGGVFSVTLGFLILFDGPVPEMRVQRAVVLPIALTLAGIMAFLTYRTVSSRRWKVTTGQEGLVGEIGTALTDVGPSGRVFVHGEYWSARAAEPIAAGSQVRVRGISDMVVEVERA